jgi:hypothetical protein
MNFDAYNAAHAAADRVSERMVALRQADRDVAQYCGGMAFDGATAEDVYRAGLDHLGVPKRDTVGLRAPELRVILKTLPRFGTGGVVTRSSAAMAFDSTATSALDSILKGIKPPRDGSHRNDFRRCL